MTSMQTQFFISAITCNFNLRRPKVDKPTNVYCVIYQNGKQHYFATGLKVMPEQWNKKKQIAMVSNTLTTLDNRNNNILNDKIKQLKGYYQEYIDYLCSNPDDTDKLYKFIYRNMQKNVKASKLMEQALEIYRNRQRNLTSSTLNGQDIKLNAFIKYLNETGKDDVSVLSQQGLNDYKDYLLGQAEKVEVGKRGGGIASINQKCQFVVLMIKDVLSCHKDFLKYKIAPVSYKTIKDERGKEDKTHFSLTKEEIDRIKDCKGLDAKQELYRDIFILQCNCGQRISDVVRYITNTNIEKEKIKGQTIVRLKTKKEKTTSYFIENEETDRFFSKYKDRIYTKNGQTFIRREGREDLNVSTIEENHLYNDALKQIAKKAELNRKWNYKDAQGRDLSLPIHQLLTSHDARHTFATIMRAKGYELNEVCLMLGHSSEDMVKDVYAHNDDAYNSYTVAVAAQRVEVAKPSALQSLFAYDNLLDIERLIKANVDIRELPQTENAATIIKDTSTLPAHKKIDGSKAKGLDRLVFYLAYLLKDKQLYAMYQYKLRHYGLIDKTDDVDRLFMSGQYKKAEGLLTYKDTPSLDVSDVEKTLNSKLNDLQNTDK